MDKNTMEELKKGMETAFIDQNVSSNLAYKPEFIFNNFEEGRKVLSSLEEELLSCEEFSISVAFITMGGIQPLLHTLKELERREIPGRILTTDYLVFSDPKALKRLHEFKNIRLRMYDTSTGKIGFHTKGYIFKQSELYHIIVGSSNLTQSALTKNREWNSKIVSFEQGEYTNRILDEFDQLWNSQNSLEYDDFIEEYSVRYELVKKQKQIARQAKNPLIEQYRLQPNRMQIAFVDNLIQIKAKGARKALLISATGTGKTYASAFALRELNPKRALFIVHREQIARQAIKSYSNVFGGTKSFGLLSGNSKDFDADFLFATMQMLSKQDILEQFQRNAFDIIIIDEVHRAGAESYNRILKYFEPDFWLGMTASPERTDGFDIYNLFDYNIAYEILLQQALEEDLLCPFHYFGITDLEINGEVFDDASGIRNFANLVCDARVNYILEQAAFYGFSGNRVKGLIFCSRKEEAIQLSNKFNQRGLHTVFLCGDDSQEKREQCIERLVRDEQEDYLDYIFTVDIFNEGVDIPEINQVIMLRPTESPIVFVQQLGRGLRKTEEKEYVVVLDFIGNYMNNFMIPIALSGDRTYNKDTIRRYLREGTKIIPGSSTIHFDEITKKRIFQSIDKAKTTKKLLAEKYMNLKHRLGRVPNILDFYDYGEIDPQLLIDYAKTYDNFVRLVDKDYTIHFTEEEEAVLGFISAYLINGKRPHELIMLKLLLRNPLIRQEEYKAELEVRGERYREADYQSAFHLLTKDFINSQSEKKAYKEVEFFSQRRQERQFIERADFFMKRLNHLPFEMELSNLIEYGLRKYEDCYKQHDEDNLVLYQKYSRKDVCRILNWERDDSATIYGYRIKYNTCPIFVTYEKKEDITSSTKYEDHFVDNQVFSWMTRSKVTMNSSEAQQLINYKENGLKIYLFIKKSDGEGADFYYMGKVIPVVWTETVIENDKGINLPIMNFQMKLEHNVRNDIFEYLTK